MTPNERALEDYRATLRRKEQDLRMNFDMQLHCDKGAVDIGIVTLRTALLINGASVVALLAFVGQLWSKVGRDAALSSVLHSMSAFVYGVIFAAAGAGVAYFYQSYITAQQFHNVMSLSAKAGTIERPKWLNPAIQICRWGMIILVVMSFIAFIVGTARIKKELGQ